MASPQDEIESIIRELTKLQGQRPPFRDEEDEFPLPRMIAAGDGGSIIVSRRIDEAIAAVADRLLKDRPELAPKYTRAEWRTSVRAAFGPALASIDLDDDVAANAEVVLGEVKTALERGMASHGPRELTFGVTLFSNEAVEPFQIGPVRFERRLDWLSRKCADGGVSTTTRRRIERTWQGGRLRKRKPSRDSIVEREILDALNRCAFVCSVAIDGLAAEAGRQRALTAARLAMAGVALMWRTPSKALAGFNLSFDRRLHHQISLTFIPELGALAGSSLSHMPHGPWLKTGEWERMMSESPSYWTVLGEVLDFVVSPDGAVGRPKLMNTLAQALIWFHEGCRETVNLMAIVNFSAALDALARGGGSRGIKRLMRVRLGMDEGKPIRPDGPTLASAIDEIYGDGRSRTIHGTNNKLNHDWSEPRGRAEQFARYCLLSCIDWAAEHPGVDDPAQLSQ